MGKLQDTDIMLVNRSNDSYKITGAELKESLEATGEIATPTIIAPPDGSGVGLIDEEFLVKTSAVTDVVTVDGSWSAKSNTGTTGAAPNIITYSAEKNLFVAGQGNIIIYSSNAEDWTEVNVGRNITCTAYGNGKFVACGFPNNGHMGFDYSEDGISWSPGSSTNGVGAPDYMNGVTYADNKFVAVGPLPQSGISNFYYSNNGISWSPSPQNSTGNNFQGVAYGNSVWVAVGIGRTAIATSSDGINWTDTTDIDGMRVLNAIAFGDGLFVAAGDGYALTSTDGVTWTANTNLPASSLNVWRTITYADGKFTAAGYYNEAPNPSILYYSIDGINWSKGSVPSDFSIGIALGYGANKYIFMNTYKDFILSTSGTGKDSSAITLTDANTYNAETDAIMDQPISETFTAGQVVAGVKAGETNATGTLLDDASGNTMTVEPLMEPDFKLGTAPHSAKWRSIAYGDGVFIANGEGSNGIMRSTDGISWTAITSVPSIVEWFSLAYGDGKFVAFGIIAGSPVTYYSYYSDDGGVTWTGKPSLSNAQFSWNTVAYGNGKFVALSNDISGNNSKLIVSDDGVDWETSYLSDDLVVNWQSVTYGELPNGTKRFVAVGLGASGLNKVMYSSNGSNWTSANATSADNWNVVAYGNGKFVAVAATGSNRVMWSADGISWTAATATENNGWYALTYGAGMFVALSTGGTNQVMYSSDAITWSPSSSAVDNSNWQAITYGDGKFVGVADNTLANGAMYSLAFGAPFVDGMDIYRQTPFLVPAKKLTFTPKTSAITGVSDSIVNVTNGSTNVAAGDMKTDTGFENIYDSELGPDDPGSTFWDLEFNTGGYTQWQPGKPLPWSSGSFRLLNVQNLGDTATFNFRVFQFPGNTNKNVEITSGDTINIEFDQYLDAADAGLITVNHVSGGTNLHLRIYGTEVDGAITKGGGYVVPNGLLTLTDANTYDADTNEDVEVPISKTFTAGQTVTGVKAGETNATGTLLADASGNTMTVTPSTAPDFKLATGVENGYFRSVAYGNGMFVAVSSDATPAGNRVMYSTDGINWTAVTGVDNSWYTVTYGELADGTGRFVAGGVGPTSSMYSDDGINWTVINATSYTVNTITYGNGKFVAILSETAPLQVLYSPDGITWTNAAAAQANNWSSVTYGELPDGTKRFVAVCGGNGTKKVVMYSNDGITWTSAPKQGTSTWQSVTYGDGKFVAVANSGSQQLMYSTDGINWVANPPNAPEANYWSSITYGNGAFVAVAYTGTNRVMYSTDAINWTSASAAADNSWLAITYGAGKYVAVSGGPGTAMYSPALGGTFVDGMEVINDTTATLTAPSADDLEFVGSTPTDEPLGSINTWGDSTWEVSVDSAFTAPMVGTKIITPGSNQTLLPNERGAIVLDFNTDYYARLSYNATNPALDNVTSSAVHFKTAERALTVDDMFNVTVYSGQDTAKTITTGINYLEDTLVWIKSTAGPANNDHYLVDRPRDDYDQRLRSNTNDAGTPNTGFTPANGSFLLDGGVSTYNRSDYDYVNYSFRTAPNFFDIVTYEGTGVNPTAFPHALSVTPGAIIFKRRDSTGDWMVYHKDVGDNYLILNKTNTATTGGGSAWEGHLPTETEFTLDDDGRVNGAGSEYIAYLFADTPGLIKCGSYTASATSGATTSVDCGFEPQWVMIKITNFEGPWAIRSNKSSGTIFANTFDREGAADTSLVFTNTGFDVSGIQYEFNRPSAGYVYIAIAKGGSTRFFDTEAFQAITDSEVTARYGVDPYSTNLEALGIKQLMEEPVGVTAGYALCEDSNKLCAVENHSNVVASLEDEKETIELRKAAFRQIIRNTAIAIAGIYPLFKTEELANAAGDGVSHSHTIDGVTYYMPDNGMDIYHGDYS